jgi:hypothetical protein
MGRLAIDVAPHGPKPPRVWEGDGVIGLVMQSATWTRCAAGDALLMQTEELPGTRKLRTVSNETVPNAR